MTRSLPTSQRRDRSGVDTGLYGEASTPAVAPGPGPLAAVADIPVGGGTIFAAQQVVITQPAEGEFRAFSTTCTHQGCAVATVADGTINCTCHGSRFAIADGSVTAGPAPRPLDTFLITRVGDTLSITWGEFDRNAQRSGHGTGVVAAAPASRRRCGAPDAGAVRPGPERRSAICVGAACTPRPR